LSGEISFFVGDEQDDQGENNGGQRAEYTQSCFTGFGETAFSKEFRDNALLCELFGGNTLIIFYVGF